MLSIRLSRISNNDASTIHGVSTMGMVNVAVNPKQYVMMLHELYIRREQEIADCVSPAVYFRANHDETQYMGCTLYMDTAIPTLKTMGDAIRNMMQPDFYPACLGYAFPMNRTLFDRVKAELESRERLPLPNSKLGIEPNATPFMSAELKNVVEFITPIRPRSSDMKDTIIYMIGIDMRHENSDEYEFKDTDESNVFSYHKIRVVDEGLYPEPHILIMRPNAVTWS